VVKGPLTAGEMARDPITQFGRWFRRALRDRRIHLPEAMCLSTVGTNGAPQGRMVLLKGFDRRGFVFYTDTRSPKGRALRLRPRAALTFYWPPLGRQVRIEGLVKPVPSHEADRYFQTRPRGSQVAAWASYQSRTLTNRAELERRVAEMKRRFRGQAEPRPPYWSGWRPFGWSFGRSAPTASMTGSSTSRSPPAGSSSASSPKGVRH